MKKLLYKSLVYLFSLFIVFSSVVFLFEAPALASGEYSCTDSYGAPYAYHMEFSGADVTVYQWNVADGEYDTIETFDLSGMTGTTDQINGFTMDFDGNMYAKSKKSDQ